MDKPADPATPFREVYQAFLDDLALDGAISIGRHGIADEIRQAGRPAPVSSTPAPPGMTWHRA
jgi:hypothetical protein